MWHLAVTGTLTLPRDGVSCAPCRCRANRAWQLPWLRLHLLTRALLATPAGGDWPIVKRELLRCAELRRAIMQAGWFN